MKNLFTLLVFIGAFTCANAGVVDTVEVHSAAMDKKIKNVIITPDSYKKSKGDYPILYLLHGAGGRYDRWIKMMPELQQLVDVYQMVIVCPDAKTSWYFDSPIDKTFQYETYVAKELVGYMNKKYRIAKETSKHAISGLSMGGHGAFYLAFKHHDIWGAAGSMSGGVDITPFPFGWNLPKRLGSYADNKKVWEEHSVINMLHLLKWKKPKLIFDCGTSDFFYKQNKALHEKMLYSNIPHDYTERPGGHNAEYWQNSIKYHLLFFDKVFKENKR